MCDVTARDPDFELNGTVVYMFTGTSYQQFKIDPLGKLCIWASIITKCLIDGLIGV